MNGDISFELCLGDLDEKMTSAGLQKRTKQKTEGDSAQSSKLIQFPRFITYTLKKSILLDNFSLKPGFHMIVRIVPVVSKKNVQTTGTIIWKRYPDDRKRPGRFKIYTIAPIVRIELNSIQAIEVVSVVRVVCDRLGSVSI